MPPSRQKFSTSVNSETLARVREIAAEELADLVEKRRQARPRPHVLTAYQGSLGKYDELYKKLAK